MLAAVLAACGGGDTGPAGPPGTNGTNGTNGTDGTSYVATVNVGSNSTTPSAATTAAWSALSPQVTITSVTINSAPVVKFKVTDAAGVPVVGLGNKSQSSTATVASLTNLSFTLAKLVPGTTTSVNSQLVPAEPSKWVSYLVTKPVTVAQAAGTIGAADSCNQTATTKATVCGTFPTTDAQGTLVDNGDGTYEYTFYRDITQTATVVAGLTDSANGLSKTADMGDLSYDPTLTHRLGIIISGSAPGTGTNTPNAVQTVAPVPMVNTFNMGYDFVPAGGTPTTTRDIVTKASCTSCHDGKGIGHFSTTSATNGVPPGAFVGRNDPRLCVTCHTDQIKYSFDAGDAPMMADGITFAISSGTNAVVRPAQAILGGRAVGNYPNLIHKTHMGDELVLQNYNFNNNGDAQMFNTVGFPQSPTNCTKCHSGSTGASALNATATTNGDNWKNNPSMLACGACHDGIKFATGTGITLADRDADVAAGNPVGTTQTGHVGGAQADNSKCALCHDSTTIPVYHRTTVPSANNPTVKAGATTFDYKISSATINASKQLVVKFQILKNGTPTALNAAPATTPLTGFTGGPTFMVTYATGQDGIAAPTDWNSGHDSLSLLDAINGTNGNVLSVADASTNTYQVTIVASSAGAYSTVHSLALPNDAKMVTVSLKDSFTDPTFGALPGTPAMMAATGNTPDGKPNVARRVIFSEAKCDSCHDRLGTSPNFHGGNYSIAMCAACHTPIQGGSTGWSASFRVWVHGIHSAEKRTVPFTWHGVSTTDNYSNLLYPGLLKDCQQCHLPGTYDFSATQYTDAMIGSMLDVTAATGTKILASSFVPPQAAPVGSGATTGLLAYGLISGADYGTGPAIDKVNAATMGQIVAGTGTDLVTSPITAVCSTCHDSSDAIAHMRGNGGSFYAVRSTAVNTAEACLVCHGPGRIAAIADVHK